MIRWGTRSDRECLERSSGWASGEVHPAFDEMIDRTQASLNPNSGRSFVENGFWRQQFRFRDKRGPLAISIFRHPKTQNERRSDQALQHDDEESEKAVRGRTRSGRKGGGLPTEREHKIPAAQKDRARGKKSHSPARKSKSRRRDSLPG